PTSPSSSICRATAQGVGAKNAAVRICLSAWSRPAAAVWRRRKKEKPIPEFCHRRSHRRFAGSLRALFGCCLVDLVLCARWHGLLHSLLVRVLQPTSDFRRVLLVLDVDVLHGYFARAATTTSTVGRGANRAVT